MALINQEPGVRRKPAFVLAVLVFFWHVWGINQKQETRNRKLENRNQRTEIRREGLESRFNLVSEGPKARSCFWYLKGA